MIRNLRKAMVSLVLVALSGWAFAADPVKVTLYVPGNVQDLPDLPSVVQAGKAYSGPKVGAYLDLQPISWGDWSDKKRLMLQSGEEADIVFTATWNDFEDEVARNAWLPLNDLIAKNAPGITKAVGPWLKGPTVGGKIYAVPTVKESGTAPQFLFNKKFVDKYKFDVSKVKGFADLEPMLQKIKDSEPGVIPYLIDTSSELPITYRMAWEKLVDKFYTDPATGKVKYVWNIEESWKLAKVMNSWFKKGFFQPEIADGTDDTAREKYYKPGNWFAASHVSHPGKAGELSNQWGYPIVGSGPIVRPMVNRDAYTGALFAISRTSKHPVEAIKLIELMNTDKAYNNLWNWGIEGKHYSFENKAKGIVNPIKGSGYNLSASWMMQNQFISYITPAENPDKWALYEKFNASAGEWPTVGMFPDLKPVKNQISSVENTIKKFEIILLRGLQDLDKLKAQVQKAVKDAGVEAIEAELQKQVNAFIAAKKP